MPTFGGARPLKTCSVTVKSEERKKIFHIFKGCAWSKICAIICFKSINWRETKKYCLPSRRANPFLPILGAYQKYETKLNSKFSFCRLFFDIKFKTLLPRARGQIRRFFGIGPIKINLIGSIVPVFENSKKFKITPPYCTVYTNFTALNLVTNLHEENTMICNFTHPKL